MRPSMPSATRRSVSVVVPVRNEAESIAMLLESLRAQTRPPDEIVVCDGGSTDGTPELIEDYMRRGMPVRVVRGGPAFPGRARNLAIDAARGDLIALTDAGVRLDPRWLERLAAPFEGPSPPDVVYGHFEPVKESFSQRCIAVAFVPPRNRRSGLRCTSVASMAMCRGVWTALGGFREGLRSSEDLLFMLGIARSGLSVRYVPNAVVFWNPPKDLVGAFRRFAAYSYSNIHAGLFWGWQIRLVQVYVITAMLTATVVWTPLGYVAPLAVLGFRAMKRAIREMGLAGAVNVPLIAGTMLAIGVIDAATFCGCWRWLTNGRSSAESGPHTTGIEPVSTWR